MHVLRQSGRRPPSVPTVVSALMDHGAIVQPLPESSGTWPSGTFHAYVPNTSTRGLVLTVEGGRFTIGVPTLAAPEERALAWRLAETLSARTGDTFLVDGAPLRDAPDADADFARDCADIAPRARRAVLTFPGPNREFHVGPRLVDELGVDPNLWLGAMRRVQYGTVEDAPRAKRDSARGSVSIVAAQPGTTAVLGWSDLVALGTEEDALAVPFARFIELASGRAVALDERNVVLGALTTREWEALVERARPYAVDDLVDATPSVPPAAPLAVEVAPAEDIPGRALVRTRPRRAEAPELPEIPSSRWALPVFGGLLLALAVVLGLGLLATLALWLQH